MPKISIIIPLYNQKEFVGRAIESALDQSRGEKEVIVVDDGSTDSPQTVLDSFGSDIVFVRQENRGLAGARNTGIKKAQGDYFQFLDADDFLQKDKLKLQLAFMEEKNADVSYCEVAQYDHPTGETSVHYVGKLDDPFPNLYNEWYTYPFPIHSLLFKKDIFDKYGEFPEDLGASEDRFYLSVLALNGVTFDYFPFIGGGRRRHRGNMTGNRMHIYRNMVRYYEKINGHPVGAEYIKDNYNYTGKEMMRANLTHMFLKDIAEGFSIPVLLGIRNMLREKGISFFFRPIPSTRLPVKALLLIALSIYRRYSKAISGLLSSF
ncbi:glycosyltransferase family 2 protein [Thermodesulfobacteriota bacterium]